MSAGKSGSLLPGILYISYDGMLEPLGQSQVLSYLERLAPGRRIHLISFEKPADWAEASKRKAMQQRISAAGITWHPLRYHKSPTAPATAYDIAAGSALAIYLVRRHRLGLVHARSYVAAAMALAAKKATGAEFLFDMRGFWADERVDGALWPPNGNLYRAAKGLERKFLLVADHVVTLTHASEREIRRFDYLQGRDLPISVIPTCADLDRFTIGPAPAEGPFTLGYVGSVGTWYLLDEMLQGFSLLQARIAEARLLIVNRSEQEMIRQRASALGIDEAAIEITAAEHREVPMLIRRMHAAMALIKPAYSKIASAPTKLAEYLGCGVPCLGNAGVGDVQEILEGRRVGAVVQDLSDAGLAAGVEQLRRMTEEPGIRERCRKVALDLFSLEIGVAAYNRVYDDLAGGRS